MHFEALADRDGQAIAAGVMFLPGAGFDVVPSDCLAAHVQTRLGRAAGAMRRTGLGAAVRNDGIERPVAR
jgi:short subunit dehydrogenase-like uncharacterized protein